MKTTLDLPRPLLLRIAARAARMRVPVSRYVAESLEKIIPTDLPTPTPPPGKGDDPLFEELRQELGL
ncbi:hypothetical protein ACFQY0_05930 [Haloferula chungangensis]|uniref:CopG family transcriptional regulator n=1 Tax=Haloferula chungangensis TaxID=1048331 RepID=A0ABW2L5B6_9BACT